MEANYSLEDFKQIIARLRGENGCPWDKEQTHESLKQCMIEEAYEVVEGIDHYVKTKDDENLCEELGDVLLQVVMHCQIAEEENRFTMDDVIRGISQKMIRRHPHVFGDVTVESSEDVLKNWDEIKRVEKSEETISESMKRVPRAFPSTLRAVKIQKKAAKVGFEFPTYEEALEKVYEEIKELENARKSACLREIDEEFGDLMFAVVNLSRFLQLNVENSLTNATDKFINRFVDVEKCAKIKGQHLNEMSIDDLKTLWGRVK